MATAQTSLPAIKPHSADSYATILDQLSAWNVQIPNQNDVLLYLAKFPDTADVLPALSSDARHAFGSDVELSLEIYRDPEIVDEYLSLYVRKEHYQPGFMSEIEAIRNRHDEALLRTTGYLLLTSDYCCPSLRSIISK